MPRVALDRSCRLALDRPIPALSGRPATGVTANHAVPGHAKSSASLIQHGMSLNGEAYFQRGMSLKLPEWVVDHSGHGDRHERCEAEDAGAVEGVSGRERGGRFPACGRRFGALRAHQGGVLSKLELTSTHTTTAVSRAGAPRRSRSTLRQCRGECRIDSRANWGTEMSMTYTEVERQARSLSAEERAQLVDTLLESLHGSGLSEVQAAWATEIERRVAAYERGEATLVDAEEVFAKARRISGQ